MKMLTERAMTFLELMLAVVIVGILAAAAILPNIKTIESAKRKSARTVLESIAGGEKVYQTFNTANGHIFCSPATSNGSPADCTTWDKIFSDNPNTPQVIPGVTFTVDVTALGLGFTATATRTGGRCNGDIVTLDELGVEGGNWPINGC